MKPIHLMFVILAVQIVAMLIFARIARLSGSLLGDVGMIIGVGLAYGIPALIAFIGHFRFALPRTNRLWRRVGFVVIAGLLTFFGHIVSIIILQRTDIWLTWRYIHGMRVQLHDDPRFKEVRLICYSDDYILFPYIPVAGTVATEEDRKTLDHILQESHPPAYASAAVVQVGLSREQLARWPNEEEP